VRSFLEKRLKERLPGEAAHVQMAPKSKTGNRLRFRHSDNPRLGAVMILFFKKNDQWYFPLIQRPKYEGVHSGQMALPGGRFEPSDPDLITTALRETHEEIGVEPKDVEVLGQLSEFFVAASNHKVLPVVGFCDQEPKFVPDPTEVEEVILASLDELLDVNKLKAKQITTTYGYQLQSPYFHLGEKVVWGATAMMLNELRHILQEA